MSVGTFDPTANRHDGVITDQEVQELLTAARHLNKTDFGLDEVSRARLASAVFHVPASSDQKSIQGGDWAQVAQKLDADEIELLIRLLTLGESQIPSWDAGAKSPVVPLAAELRSRDCYPKELTAWIKSNSRNRFLPWGSLMDRL